MRSISPITWAIIAALVILFTAVGVGVHKLAQDEQNIQRALCAERANAQSTIRFLNNHPDAAKNFGLSPDDVHRAILQAESVVAATRPVGCK